MDPLSGIGLIGGPAMRPGKTKLKAPIVAMALGLAFLAGLWVGYGAVPAAPANPSAAPCPAMAPISRAAAAQVSFRAVVTGVSDDRLTLNVLGGRYAGSTVSVTAPAGTEIYALVPENELSPPVSPTEPAPDAHYERRDIPLARLAAQDVVDVDADGELGPGASLAASRIVWKMSIVGASPENGKPVYSTEFGRLLGKVAAAGGGGSDAGLPPPETLDQ